MSEISGRWKKLTDYLKNNGDINIVLHDDDIQRIVNSNDNRRPYPIDFFDSKQKKEYSIKNRARKAGYDVLFDENDKCTKIFTRNL